MRDGPTGSPMETQLLPDAWYMMNAVRSALNSRFLSPSNARFAVVSWAFSISCRRALEIGLTRRRDRRLRGAQQAPQRVGGGDHGGEQQGAQTARRRRFEGKLPPQFIAVGHVPIREEDQPGAAPSTNSTATTQDPRSVARSGMRAGESAPGPRPAPPRQRRESSPLRNRSP